jgi:dihydroorotase-like cyclic amidohydrolase
MKYTQKLDEMEARFEALTSQMADPAVISDSDLYRKTAKAHSDLAEVVGKYRDWKEGEPIITHAEDRTLVREGVVNEGPVSTRLGLPGNPSTAEVIHVARDILPPGARSPPVVPSRPGSWRPGGGSRAPRGRAPRPT